ncbi:MgtC/SapB family protein [Mycolicibacterium litorale]|uniref:Mg2+ transport P-type ATPase C MgtC n=1 Tax=Mycolicibacterium litorale TaxID=758802 RepID=A0AAD1IFQ6_9MYCO|nr:MgtC/SapB family protein [Mycolicibacterium litorale]MCV7418690.1 MgtC/SapB family protein [Mycolicibacterium litorale]TDY05912.1 putative Mg2+ transporter-C (MgtC) family protein [Mycolicibacterium litorale]BBY14582.1 putative Mg2+ transport P-type ATPase C MgtC [Mycolicibacterium litorale]
MLAVDLLTRVGLATLLGVAIGLERQWRSRMAGLQTMALVSTGSALYLILGAYSFPNADPTRVAAQIVTGIGFLGAGVIMKQGMSVTGLNTAATLWSTAAVGALAGAWLWREALASAVIVLAANLLLQPLAETMDRRKNWSGREHPPVDYLLTVVCRDDRDNDVRALLIRTVGDPRLTLTSMRSAPAGAGTVEIRVGLSAAARDDAVLEAAVGALAVDARIQAVQWSIPDEAAERFARP